MNYIDGRTNKKVYCQDCGKLLSHSRYKFCKSCAIIGDRHFKVSKSTRKKMSKIHSGKIVSIKTRQIMSESRRGENNGNWQGGIDSDLYPYEFYKIREFIRDRDNRECQLCNIKEIELYRKLDVHHIDYNKNNCIKENLISLCKKCNLKVNGSRDYWFVYFNELMLQII